MKRIFFLCFFIGCLYALECTNSQSLFGFGTLTGLTPVSSSGRRGTLFKSLKKGVIVGLKFYVGTGDSVMGSFSGGIHNNAYTLLSETVNFPYVSSVGWQTAQLKKPYVISSSTEYVVLVNVLGNKKINWKKNSVFYKNFLFMIDTFSYSAGGYPFTSGVLTAINGVNLQGSPSLNSNKYYKDILFIPTSSVFSTSTPTGSHITFNNPGDRELGMVFHTIVSGYIYAIRFYKSSTDTVSATDHKGRIWDEASQNLLAVVSFSLVVSNGWNEQLLLTPLQVTAGTKYIVTVNSKDGSYAENSAYAYTSDDGNIIAEGTRYATSFDAFPELKTDTSNHYRDIVFSPCTTSKNKN